MDTPKKNLELDRPCNRFTCTRYKTNTRGHHQPAMTHITNVGERGSIKARSITKVCSLLFAQRGANKNGLIVREVRKWEKTNSRLDIKWDKNMTRVLSSTTDEPYLRKIE